MSPSRPTPGSNAPYTRPDPAQVKGRVPLATADLLDWAVAVTAKITEPGRLAPSKNAAIIAALEEWARNVLANHPDAAAETVGVLHNNNNFTGEDAAALRETLDRLGLADLVEVVSRNAQP